jgi:AcrR family transcriptional regulator
MQTSTTATRPAGGGPTRAPHTQRRGEERRRLLLDAAAAVLVEREIDAVSLEDIAREAGIPVTSAYHFYRDRHSVLAALAARYGEAFEQLMRRPLPAHKVRRWEDVIELLTDRAVRYYAVNPTARKLLIDGKAPADIKLADRIHDRKIGTLLEAAISRHFELPVFPGREAVFYNGVEIVDVMLQVSMIRSRRITSFMVRHAKIASIAYLREFLPASLPARAR